ncbi:hypothetical protein [Pasteurella sp. PK-2025]|uniref:hypothetical protein n=1 Tax=unclassified Pasteurella TaxID=2621516 RepID=UPI003C714927
MSFNYTEDTSPTLADWEVILNAFNCNISEDEVWEIARQYSDIPHFGNIYQNLVLNRLKLLFWQLIELEEGEIDININYDINARSSYFYIEGDCIYNESDFLNKVDSIKAMLI